MWHLGVAGDPVSHSLSPSLQLRALGHLGLQGETSRLQTTSVSDVAAFLAGPGSRALSITTPLKNDVLSLCDDVDEKSIVAGAVNSVICRQGKILGRNVDGEGLVAALEASTDHRAAGTHVVVVGGGGAARSCVASLVSHDAVVTVMTRRPAERAGWNDGAILTSDMRIPSTSEWVINATNSTLKGEGLDLLDLGPDHALAVDLSYGRPSRFLEECATRGWATLDGLPMLYFQAKLQFEWWFEQELDVEVLGWHA